MLGMEQLINGIDVEALTEVIDTVCQQPARGIARFHVTTNWKEHTRSETVVESFGVDHREIKRRFVIASDQPRELLGKDSAPNPQELLLAALNSCLTVGYVVGAATRGISLEKLQIQSAGELDLRGFLGISPDVAPGYETIRFHVRIKGDGTAEQFQEIHEAVMRTSPNYFSVANPVRVEGDLVIE